VSDAIVFASVTFRYPESPLPVIDDVSLALPEGSLVLLSGATGSGKSTLLRAMNGLVPHFTGGSWTGRVMVAGRDTLEMPPRRLADVVGFVPQDPGAAFVLDKVEDELAYGMENLGVAASVMRRRVEETLDLLNLASLRGRSVRTLSGGERQRVAIAAALAAGPRILLLDEPTSQLDPQGAEDVLAALQRLVHDLGMTVIVAEHRLERVAGFADVVLGCPGGGAFFLAEPRAALHQLGLGPPVTRLGRLLGWAPMPLTVREARARAMELRAPPNGSPRGATRAHVASAGAPAVAVTRLSAGYGGPPAVRDVSLAFGRGEVALVMGRNGAGKSTLLRCITGLQRPAAGVVSIAGAAPRPGRNVALCPQTPEAVLFRDTVRDEVETTLGAVRSSRAADEVLDDHGIAQLASRHPRDLSAGERLLVAVAAIVATGAPVLLLDEPTRGLDPECKQRLAGFLEGWTGDGNTAVIATHDVELAAALATRTVILAEGEVIAEGAPDDILGQSSVFAPQMTRVFGPGWLTPEQVAHALATT
jgi:energy-coupling factor transport system ATP-binding protein